MKGLAHVIGYHRYLLAGALLLVLTALLPGACHAAIILQEATELPGSGFYSDDPLPAQAIPVDAIRSEIDYLSQNKIFDGKDFNVRFYNYQVYWMSEGKKVPYGGTCYKDCVYIFSGFWNDDSVSSAVVHEIGHMFRKYYLTDAELQEYIKSRGAEDGSIYHGVASIKEELFAEDFRMLFGNENARTNMYSFYNTIDPPTEKDRELILKLAGKLQSA
jgi:hypothetical protein